MLIHIGILYGAGSQFSDDKPRLELTWPPTLHWHCLHITLQLLQEWREWVWPLDTAPTTQGRRLGQTQKAVGGTQLSAWLQCVCLCLKCPLSSPSLVKNEWRQEGDLQHSKTRKGKKKWEITRDEIGVRLGTGNLGEKNVDWWLGRDTKRGLQRNPAWANSCCSVKTLWRLISPAQHLANIPVIRTSAGQPSVSPSLSTAACLLQDWTCIRALWGVLISEYGCLEGRGGKVFFFPKDSCIEGDCYTTAPNECRKPLATPERQHQQQIIFSI